MLGSPANTLASVLAQRVVYDHIPGFSFTVFFGLALICVSSACVFWVLVRRWTSHRHWLSLGEWARESGFRARRLQADDLPQPLAALWPQIRLSFTGKKGMLIQLQTEAAASAQTMAPPLPLNVLVRKTSGAWIPSALRPAAQPVSFLDSLGLSTYAAYSTAERFHVLSADNAAARKLAKSSARALLPADIGLLLWGEWMVLDFTQRPFDPIEFGRMLSLAEQVAQVAGT